MQCYHHPNVGAVIQCNQCSKGMCKECAEQNNSKLCHECILEQLKHDKMRVEKLLKEIPWVQTKAIIAIIWTLIFIGFGIFAGFKSYPQDMWVLNAMICFAIGGFPSTYSFLSQPTGVEKDIKEIRNRARYGKNGSTLAEIVKFIIGTIISAIAAPFALYIAIIKFKNTFKERQELENILTQIEDVQSNSN